MNPLSRKAREARKPPPPEVLADAMQASVHVHAGTGRAAKTAGSENRESLWTCPECGGHEGFPGSSCWDCGWDVERE